MRIEVRGRNVEVTDELEDAIHKRFKRVGRQVSELATLEIELSEERNPRVADSQIAEATLQLKRTTVRAHVASPEMLHSIHKIAEDVRRQVKKNRELRRGRAAHPPRAGRPARRHRLTRPRGQRAPARLYPQGSNERLVAKACLPPW